MLFQSESDAASTSLLVAAFNGRADKVNPAKTTIGPLLFKRYYCRAGLFGSKCDLPIGRLISVRTVDPHWGEWQNYSAGFNPDLL